MDFKKEIIKEIALGKKPLAPKENIGEIIQDSIKSSEIDGVEKQNIAGWLSTRGDGIDKIMRSSLARKILWILFRDKEDYVARLNRKLNRYPEPIKHWLRNFIKLELINERDATIGKEKLYRLSKKHPTIVNALIELIRREDGEKWLEKHTQGKFKDGKIINHQYESVRKSIKKRKQKSNIQKAKK